MCRSRGSDRCFGSVEASISWRATLPGEGRADCLRRVTGHHGESIFMPEEIFGTTIAISATRVVPVRFIGE